MFGQELINKVENELSTIEDKNVLILMKNKKPSDNRKYSQIYKFFCKKPWSSSPWMNATSCLMI